MNTLNKTDTSDLNKAQLGALTKVGVSLADSFIGADVKASTTKKELLLGLASKYYDKPKYEIVLDSYKAELVRMGMSENSANVRKSEALQVIKSANHTEVSGDNLSLLKAFKGEYNAFIGYARELNDKANAKEGKVKPSPTRTKPSELTETQAKHTSENLQKSNVIQLQSFVSEAISQVNNKAENPTIAGKAQFSVISNIANNILSNDKIDEALKADAKAILAISEAVILRIETAEKATKEAMNQATEQQAVA